MKRLELKIPPPLLCMISILFMYAIDVFFPLFVITLPLVNLVLFSCCLIAGYFFLSGVYEFKKAKTTVHPIKVEKASTVVNSGVYRFTRNPMYFALLLLLIGYGYWQQNLLSFLVCIGFVAYINQFQIKPEERFLEQKFGEAYIKYKTQVKRWI